MIASLTQVTMASMMGYPFAPATAAVSVSSAPGSSASESGVTCTDARSLRTRISAVSALRPPGRRELE